MNNREYELVTTARPYPGNLVDTPSESPGGVVDSGVRRPSGTGGTVADDNAPPYQTCGFGRTAWEVFLLLTLFYVYAGDPPPEINEAHYWVKAKHFWDPHWLANDAFVTSGKAHFTFYATLGVLTKWFSLPTAVWIGRGIGWGLLAIGLQRLAWTVAPIRYGSLIAAAVWLAGIEYGNLAGEWVVGGIEAKVPAYASVLFALAEIVRGRWQRVWPWLGIASAFHVLVGGWTVLIAAGTFFILPKRGRTPVFAQVWGLLLGGALSLFGLIPAFWLSLGTPPEDATLAAKIYTYQRLGHHLLPAAFAWQWYLRHSAVVFCTIAVLWPIAGRRMVRPIVGLAAGAFGLALIGMILGLLPAVAPDLAANLLRYYWFRLTDSIVPLALGLGLIIWLWKPPTRFSATAASRIVAVAAVLASSLVGYSVWQRLDTTIPPACDMRLLAGAGKMPESQRQQIFQDWKAVCRWIRDNTAEEAVFLTPRHQQTFKWYAHRAEVVNWKDVPQDVPSLLDWRERFERVFPQRLGRVRVTIRYSSLRELQRDYGAAYMVVDRRVVPHELPLQQIYPTRFDQNQTYAIYVLPAAES